MTTLATRSRAQHRLLLLALALAAAFAMFVTVAHAEELPSPQSPEAKAHLLEGNKAYRLKDFELAAREYRAGAALETGPTFTFWYNLGQAYRQLGKYEDAIWFYRQFLNQAPLNVPMHRDAAKTFIDEMQRELDKAATKTGPTEPAPTPLTSPPKTHVEPEGDTRQAPSEPPRQPQVAWHRDPVAWGLVGSGAAASAVGVVFLLQAASAQDDANAEPVLSQRQDLRDRASSRRLLGGVAVGVGAGVLVAGVIKLVIHPSRSTEVSAAPVQGGVAFAMRLRF
jgi:tetratricopeptide (TPR) repeat protein